jgi:hypothetical protein
MRSATDVDMRISPQFVFREPISKIAQSETLKKGYARVNSAMKMNKNEAEICV